MSRDVIIAPEGKVNMSGSLYGKYIYPSSSYAAANMLEITEEELAQVNEAKSSSTNAPDFWADFQNSGNRTDYSYAFANWNNTSIIPLYGLNNVDKCMYALMNCKNLIDGRYITFNITNSNPNMMYVCANCSSMTHAPYFVFNNAPVIKTYTSMYASCSSLQSATVYWGNGTADPITTRNSCQNMFFKCTSIQEIDFGNSNTGSPIYLDLSACEKLNQKSVISLANSLMNVSAAASGVYTIKLSDVTYSGISSDTLSMFEAKGWTLQTPTV